MNKLKRSNVILNISAVLGLLLIDIVILLRVINKKNLLLFIVVLSLVKLTSLAIKMLAKEIGIDLKAKSETLKE